MNCYLKSIQKLLKNNLFGLIACIRYPFDWKTPHGYLIAFTAQYAGALTEVSIYTQIVVLVFGTCYLFVIIAEDITKDLEAFNTAARTVGSANWKAEMMMRLCNLLQIYTDAKQ